VFNELIQQMNRYKARLAAFGLATISIKLTDYKLEINIISKF